MMTSLEGIVLCVQQEEHPYRDLLEVKERDNEAVALLSVRADHQVLSIYLALSHNVSLTLIAEASAASMNLEGKVDGLSREKLAVDNGIPVNAEGGILEAQDDVAINGQCLDSFVSTHTAARINNSLAEYVRSECVQA